ncbi:hypothetical protein QCA50_005115 [Cerrena zonata]|uniref:BTB domain-containing protein n=1 Tax=Cerrena zonata TaxID=2478898 RepID=A0AAW0GKT5_9APHY
MDSFGESKQSTVDYEQLFHDLIKLEEQGPPGKSKNDVVVTIPVSESPSNSGISVSTAFNSSSEYGDGPSDVTLVSNDAVHFLVHRSRLLKASKSFGPLLAPDLDMLRLPEDANTLNVVVHVIYNIPFIQYTPTLDILLQVVKALKKYEIPLKSFLNPGTPLFDGLINKLPAMPLEVYLVAAENDLFELACEASKQLLSFLLTILTDEDVQRMGSIYLRMIFTLQTERLFVLRRLVANPPTAHAPTTTCGAGEYGRLKSAWSSASVNFVLDGKPDVSVVLLYKTLDAAKTDLPCTDCQQCVTQRVQEIVVRWSLTPKTIRMDVQDFFAVLPPALRYSGSVN